MADGTTITAFIIGLSLTFLLSRIIVWQFPQQRAMIIRNKKRPTQLHVHHAHWGSLLIILSALYMLFYNVNQWVAIVLGAGIALALDEIIPFTLLKTTRQEELEVYHKALPHTLGIFIIIILVIIVLIMIQIF